MAACGSSTSTSTRCAPITSAATATTAATTPNIDALAAVGLRFANVYASDVPCLPSRTALITGAFGIRNGVVNHGGAAADLRSLGARSDTS